MFEAIESLIDELITEGEELLKTQWQPNGNFLSGPPTYVDHERCESWRGKCEYLATIVGDYGTQWSEKLGGKLSNGLGEVNATLGTLRAVKSLGARSLLMKVTNIVQSDVFESLIEQADHLYDANYKLASAVLYRAVLEEHLRNLCTEKNININKNRPTLNDFIVNIYKANHITKSKMKWLESLAAIGNDAAHNTEAFDELSVDELKDGVAKVIREIA